MSKSYKVDGSHLLKLPKPAISKPPKSTFVDRNRHPDMRRNLGNFDYEELKQSTEKKGMMTKNVGLEKEYIEEKFNNDSTKDSAKTLKKIYNPNSK